MLLSWRPSYKPRGLRPLSRCQWEMVPPVPALCLSPGVEEQGSPHAGPVKGWMSHTVRTWRDGGL